MILVCTIVQGQDVTIINRYHGPDEKLASGQYVLQNVTEHTYIINEFEPAQTGQRSHLEAMISYALRSYADQEYHVFDKRVEALEDPKKFRQEAAEMVRNAIWIHDLPFADDFPGFSELFAEKASAIKELDGCEVLEGDRNMDGPKNKTVGLYTFQRMVYELKRAAEMEVALFLNSYLPVTGNRGRDDTESLYLKEKEFSLNPSNNNRDKLSALEPGNLFGDEDKKNDKRADAESELAPFAAKVVELLEQNSKILAQYNSRFENLQSQIDELRARESTSDPALRDEIAELRDMIRDLAEGKTIAEEDGTETRLVDAQTPTLIFAKNVHDLNPSQKAQLNAVVGQLLKNPNYAALITGYADKTGNSKFNAWISEQRAKSVRDFLRSRGIPARQLIVNFLGDAQSDSPNPLDRKVTVAYLTNY